jgi:hypothetical protein
MFGVSRKMFSSSNPFCLGSQKNRQKSQSVEIRPQVCGLPDFAKAPVVKDIPIWNFHGETDKIEPVVTSRRMIEDIFKADKFFR